MNDFLAENKCFARLKAVLQADLTYEEEPTVQKKKKPSEITAKKLFKKTPERAKIARSGV